MRITSKKTGFSGTKVFLRKGITMDSSNVYFGRESNLGKNGVYVLPIKRIIEAGNKVFAERNKKNNVQ
jgi:hypothetical protein